jgi:hypothetical protein
LVLESLIRWTQNLALHIQNYPETQHTCELHIPVAVAGQEALARRIEELHM